MEQNKDQSGAAVRGEAVSGFDSAFSDAVKGGTGAYIQNADGTTRHIDPNDMMSAEKVSACAADAPSEPSELCGIPTLRDLAELFHASAMSNTAVLIHPESARSLFDAMTTPPKDESAPLSYVCRVEPHQDRIILDDKYESIDTVRAALAKSRAADALDSQPTDLHRVLVIAEAALADIGDADREPGDDVAWCEARAAKALPTVRAAIAKLASSQPTDGGVRNG